MTSRNKHDIANEEDIYQNSYGTHLLVDFKPIDEADELLKECQIFVEQSKGGASKVGGILGWRARRRDTKLLTQYELLQPRIVGMEQVLRNIIGEVVEKKIALRIQARHLQKRLQACIEHNKSLLAVSDLPLEELREEVNKLSGESSALKSMILFNKEVLRVKNIESISKGKSFVRWGPKPSARKHLTEAELNTDPDHQNIQLRLEQLRQIREKFVSCLAAVLESRGTHLANLENCERSLETVTAIIKRGAGDFAFMSDEETKQPIPSFDHDRCSDCSYAYSITYDCTNHLMALQKQALEANQRLQALVEMRERLAETSEELSMSFAAHSFVSSNGNNNSQYRVEKHHESKAAPEIIVPQSTTYSTVDDAGSPHSKVGSIGRLDHPEDGSHHDGHDRVQSAPAATGGSHSPKSFNSKATADAILSGKPSADSAGKSK